MSEGLVFRLRGWWTRKSAGSKVFTAVMFIAFLSYVVFAIQEGLETSGKSLSGRLVGFSSCESWARHHTSAEGARDWAKKESSERSVIEAECLKPYNGAVCIEYGKQVGELLPDFSKIGSTDDILKGGAECVAYRRFVEEMDALRTATIKKLKQ